MTMEMGHGEYGGGPALDNEEHAEWKALENCAANVGRHNRKLQRPFFYAPKYVPDGIEKLHTKP
jgi:hypothetical protein